MTCCARLWDNFHRVWPSTTYPCLNYRVFYADSLCYAVTLTFDQLTLKVYGASSVTWSKSVRNLSEIAQSPTELLITSLWPWPLDLELLKKFGCHVFILCTKFEQNRIIHRWVIDNLAGFRRAILGVLHFYRTVNEAAWTQLHQT